MSERNLRILWAIRQWHAERMPFFMPLLCRNYLHVVERGSSGRSKRGRKRAAAVPCYAGSTSKTLFRVDYGSGEFTREVEVKGGEFAEELGE